VAVLGPQPPAPVGVTIPALDDWLVTVAHICGGGVAALLLGFRVEMGSCCAAAGLAASLVPVRLVPVRAAAEMQPPAPAPVG
jgi:hypothetical protein